MNLRLAPSIVVVCLALTLSAFADNVSVSCTTALPQSAVAVNVNHQKHNVTTFSLESAYDLTRSLAVATILMIATTFFVGELLGSLDEFHLLVAAASFEDF